MAGWAAGAAWTTRTSCHRRGLGASAVARMLAVKTPPAGALRLRDGCAPVTCAPGQAEQTPVGARQPGCLVSRPS
jgi:hypothetical protein